MSRRPRDRPSPPPGQLLRRVLLGTEAVYRVVGENHRGIEVEVVDVQGLPAGSRFTFRLDEVFAMQEIPAEAEPRRRANPTRAAYIRRPA